MTIMTVDCEEFYNLCQNYRLAPTEHQDRVIEAYNRLVSYCDSKVEVQRAQEQVCELENGGDGMSLNWREDEQADEVGGPEPEDELTGAAFLLMVAGVGGLMVAVGVWYLIGRWWP